ncbi:MAG: hypothetical protein IJ501_02540 [Bacilli bacterium]|nr:hypothetical protein [Bacilli bacterium]
MTNKNDKKIKEYKKRKILKYLIIFLSLLTITLESLALFKMISYLWGLIPFVICYIVKYFYSGNTIEFKKDNQKKK